MPCGIQQQVRNSLEKRSQEVDLTEADHIVGAKKICCRSCSLISFGLACRSCQTPTCLRCLVGGRLCPACAFGVETRWEDDASEAVQADEVRKLKKGQVAQLKSGVALAKSLQTHCLLPSTLSSVLWAQAAKDVHGALAAAVRRSLKPLLV